MISLFFVREARVQIELRPEQPLNSLVIEKILVISFMFYIEIDLEIILVVLHHSLRDSLGDNL